MHRLTGEVAIDPALHGRPGHLETGGDLADRPPLLYDEPGPTLRRRLGVSAAFGCVMRSFGNGREPAASAGSLQVCLRFSWLGKSLLRRGCGRGRWDGSTWANARSGGR